MITKALSLIGLAFVLVWPVPQSLAAKGGNPGKPGGGGEDPPPEPPPISYARSVILPDPSVQYLFTYSISDSGSVPGMYGAPGGSPWVFLGFKAEPLVTAETVTYPTNVSILTDVPGAEEFWINNAGIVAGTVWNPDTQQRHAVLWLEDGTEVDLCVTAGDTDSRSCAINDAGMVVVEDTASGLISVVVPEDLDGNGLADTWFLDYNGDGINDLLYPIYIDPPSGPIPVVAINASGQILHRDGILLTPDYDDGDGDGNPWVGGAAASVLLQPLPGEEWVRAYDLNDLGQIVGCSGHPARGGYWDGRATLWNEAGQPIDLGELSGKSSNLEAIGINNAGQIIGTCKDSKVTTDFLIHDGQMYKLADLIMEGGSVWHPGSVMDINENGWILYYWGDVLVPVVQP